MYNPGTGNITTKALSGDPVNQTGWYEGDGWPDGPPADDRRFLMSSGPFNMMPGDTQEVVYAILMARGSDNIQSVAELKRKAHVVREFYYGNDITDVKDDIATIPSQFKLEQNYPNPFNPTTVIDYSIPVVDANFVSIKIKLVVFDILGREVVTLVNKEQKPGNYKVNFDASKLASGIYIYQLRSGVSINSKKMILLK